MFHNEVHFDVLLDDDELSGPKLYLVTHYGTQRQHANNQNTRSSIMLRLVVRANPAKAAKWVNE